jgi:serine/threonine protein kinase/tetratricopeptide (TPR) repeat protein
MIEQTISHYRIAEKLGAGGMGIVYKALDTKLERTVALKFLPDGVAVSEADRRDLLREARAASGLDHPNIGVIHGLEESDNHQLFIVMQYYEGETVAHKISRGVIPVRESLDLAMQIARGLSAAHAHNIVHRDIKPSNIIITREHVAKIVDFGLARVVASISSTQSISSTGTLPYMSPEQILGEPIDQRADLWALGIIIVQMMTGSHPFLRPSTAAMTFAILNQPPGALDVVPPLLQPILYRALSKKPENRYPSADEMLRDLEAARAEIISSPALPAEPTLTRAITPRMLKQYMENATTPSWTTGVSKKTKWLVLGSFGMFVAAIAAFLLPPMRERFAGLAYASSEKHIAVLPFTNSSNDPEYQPVADGLMDSMTNKLSNLEAAQQSLWVVPASVVRSRKVNDPSSAYRELGATMVVQGGVERKGQDIYLTVVLIDSKRLRQIGSAQLENRGGDLAALQDQAVTHMARLMKVKISEAARTPAGSVAPSAYELYLKALGYLQRYDKPGNLDQAIGALKSAVGTDARFALGYATLGEAYRLKFQTEHHPAWLNEAAGFCQKAVQMDDRLPAAHVTLGYLNISLGKTDLALQEFQKALDINPRDAAAVMGMASANEHLSHAAEAETSYKRAIALRPDYWDGYTALGGFYDRQNRVQDAIAQYRHVIELTPDNAEGYSNLGAEYMVLNDPQSNAMAEAAFKKSIQLAPNYAAYANLGFLYMTEKRYADGVEATRQALALNDKDWRVWANLLLAYQWLKDSENSRIVRAKTLTLLEEYAAVNPQEATVQSALSTFYAEDKLRVKALAHVDSALALAPKDSAVLADVAETYEVLGDRRRALQFAQQSLKNGSTMDDLHRRLALQGLLADPSFRSGGKQ